LVQSWNRFRASGLVAPPAGSCRRCALCDGDRILLVCDEVYTGCGRTGRWFACEHTGTVPDLLVLGKALSGSLPISAAMGTPNAFAGWPPSTGEAIHTSTFLGNPVACAAALAQLEQIETLGLLQRASVLGRTIEERTTEWLRRGWIRQQRAWDCAGHGAPLRSGGAALCSSRCRG
jgi:adenosylmethionine-8-amino-7-oxononanoate aminotransferase